MSDSENTRGSYDRHRPDLPRRYTVAEAGSSGKVLTLAAPALDALDVEPGDEVVVTRNAEGDVVLERDGRDFVPASSLAPWLEDDE